MERNKDTEKNERGKEGDGYLTQKMGLKLDNGKKNGKRCKVGRRVK